MKWKLADAKNRFSELVNLALYEGPQEVDRRGDRVIIISKIEYEKLSGTKPDLKTLLMNGPSLEDIDLTRPKSTMRNFNI